MTITLQLYMLVPALWMVGTIFLIGCVKNWFFAGEDWELIAATSILPTFLMLLTGWLKN